MFVPLLKRESPGVIASPQDLVLQALVPPAAYLSREAALGYAPTPGTAERRALADAIGEDYLRRTPAHPGTIVTALETKTRMHKPLMAYI